MITVDHPYTAHGEAVVVIKSSTKYFCPPSRSMPVLQSAYVLVSCGNKFILGGDFNANHPWWASRKINPNGRESFRCLQGNRSLQALSAASFTYWPSDPNKIFDLMDFFIFSGIPRQIVDATNSDKLSSDHTPTVATVSTSVHVHFTSPTLWQKMTNIKSSF